MKRSQAILSAASCFMLVLAGAFACPQAVQAHETGVQHVHFQKPRRVTPNRQLTFRSARQASGQQSAASTRDQSIASGPSIHGGPTKPQISSPAVRGDPLVDRPGPKMQQRSSKRDSMPAKRGKTKAAKAKAARQVEVASYTMNRASSQDSQDPFPVERIARKLKQRRQLQRDEHVAPASDNQVVFESGLSDACAYCGSEGACEPSCGIGEPGCGIGEPGCGIGEPGCGIGEAGCGIGEAGCGIGEPGCGIGEPGCGVMDECGSYVEPAKPDYWCFPVCLPRLKIIEVSAGVHSFRDVRDFTSRGAGGTANYGFQEGINVGGRLPIIGRLFPQISYQLGYQAVQSRLSGTTATSDSRSQDFVTVGMYRRTPVGLQFGVVWDFMQDQLAEDASQSNADLQQIRYEISLKTPRGREFGLMAATHLNNRELSFDGGLSQQTYQSVDQYMLFYRWHFRNNGIGRCWIGGTNDSEAILGADFQVPLNDRWSLQSGFNYLIPDQGDVEQEAWNLGMNIVWHWGRTARTCHSSPNRPLFPVADNGWMFIDRVR